MDDFFKLVGTDIEETTTVKRACGGCGSVLTITKSDTGRDVMKITPGCPVKEARMATETCLLEYYQGMRADRSSLIGMAF